MAFCYICPYKKRLNALHGGLAIENASYHGIVRAIQVQSVIVMLALIPAASGSDLHDLRCRVMAALGAVP